MWLVALRASWGSDMSYGLTPTENVLNNQLKLDQSAALQGQTRQNALNALSSGVQSMVTAPARFQAQENALAMQGQQLRGARVQGAEAERQHVAKLIQGVKRAPPEMQAQVYSQMVRQAEADGLDIPDWAEDFNNFGVIEGVYSMPGPEQTALMQNISMLPESDRMGALRVHFGLEAGADARMRGQVGDRPLTNAAKLRDDLDAGRITQEDFDRETAPRGGIRVGKGGVLEVDLGRSASNTEQKALASEINLYSQLQKAGELAGLDENGRMVDPSMLTYSGKITAEFTRQAEKLGIKPTELQREALNKKVKFTTAIEQLFNAYRKEITGAAAAVQELDRLKKSFINVDMSPTEFEAAFQQYSQELQRSMRVRRKLLREGFDLRSDQGGDMMDRVFLSGGDDDPAARFSELVAEHGDDDKAHEIMMQEGY